MSTFFNFLSENSGGIFILFFIIVAAALLTQWFSWIFGRGRFNPTYTQNVTAAETGTRPNMRLRHVLSQIIVDIINDFRHVLALVIVVIFAFSMAVVMYMTRESTDEMLQAIQVVAASLGGLVGSIIGYYFGESRLQRVGQAEDIVRRDALEPVSDDPTGDFTPAMSPPPADS